MRHRQALRKFHNRRQPARLLRGAHSFARDDDGGPMVEFLLVLPLILSLTFGSMEVGFGYFTYSTMLHAARDAARQLALGGVDEAGAATLASSRLMLDRPFTVTARDTDTTGTQAVSVTISLPFQEATATRFLPLPSTPLSVTVVMRSEE